MGSTRFHARRAVISLARGLALAGALVAAGGCGNADPADAPPPSPPPAVAAPEPPPLAEPPPGAADLVGATADEFAKLEPPAPAATAPGPGAGAAVPGVPGVAAPSPGVTPPAVADAGSAAGAPPPIPMDHDAGAQALAAGAAATPDDAGGLAATPPGPPAAPTVDPASVPLAGIPTLEVRGLLGEASTPTGFRVSYAPTEVPLHQKMLDILKELRLYENVATRLNSTIKLPRTVDIHVVDCGAVNAFYDPKNRRIIMCNELMTYFLEMFRPVAKDVDDLGNAVLGATVFSFFHEAGHGLIHLLDLPSTGREEDAVDQFATLILIAGGDESVAMALAGAFWFQLQSQRQRETPFYDEHAFDGQRFYNILCWIYGSNPEKYAGFVAGGTLPEARAQRCPEEYARTRRAWETLLAPHLTTAGAETVAMGAPAGPGPAAPGEPPPVDAAPAVAPSPSTEPAPPTCRTVAEHVGQLILQQLDDEYRDASQEQIDAVVEQLKVQLPQIVEQLTGECDRAEWTAKQRRCILRATKVKRASRCGV